MKFIYEEDTKENILTFEMVEGSQFFVSINGHLFQKCTYDSANVIALPDGTPFALGCMLFTKDEKIKRILPKVVKIEF